MKIKSILTGTALSVGTGGLIAKGAAVLLHITFPAAATLGLLVAGACQINNLVGLINGENDAKEEFKETEDSRNEKLAEKIICKVKDKKNSEKQRSLNDVVQPQIDAMKMEIDSGFKAHNTRITNLEDHVHENQARLNPGTSRVDDSPSPTGVDLSKPEKVEHQSPGLPTADSQDNSAKALTQHGFYASSNQSNFNPSPQVAASDTSMSQRKKRVEIRI
ncbi:MULTISPECIES: hypothetical protein [Legionella]|uniref:Uncharacterized protein n=1 Tax=Legionella feeleii TaxID=453 RepID=A0A0W0TMF3_9GAMM|nr:MULTISPECIES: hypothetical protein [Legionella]KTC96764.1 hypothetical protein Lfee_1676 [Legionella feeleii]MCC5014280.1 hypothetical protein [Legionella sp. 31fI33]SPX60564.1 Uncharacterised protein [Legionella feeleii]